VRLRPSFTRHGAGVELRQFECPSRPTVHWREAISRGSRRSRVDRPPLATYRSSTQLEAAEFEGCSRELPQGWEATLPSFTQLTRAWAPRQLLLHCLNAIAPSLPELIGGSRPHPLQP